MAKTKKKIAKKQVKKRVTLSKTAFVVAAEPRQAKPRRFHQPRPVPHDLKEIEPTLKEAVASAIANGLHWDYDKYAVYELVKVGVIEPPKAQLIPLTPKTKKKK